MANSYVKYNGTGAQTNFVVTFPYLAKIDVGVQVGGVTTTAWTWVNATTIQITTPPPAGTLNVDIRRRTPISSPLVVYADGGVEFGADLNTTALQTLYALQEREDVFPNTTNINNVAADLTNIDAVALDLTNINLVAADLTRIDAVAVDLTNIDTVAGNTANINVVAAGLPTKLSLAGGNLTGGANFAKSTVASATTPDIFATTVGNVVDYTGTTTATGFTAAPIAGALRLLRCAGACSFTAGANMLIDGVPSGGTVTMAANDKVLVFAFTTTQFVLTLMRDTIPSVVLTDAATVAVDMGIGNGDFTLTIGGNRTLGAPTNTSNNLSGKIAITQDGTGSRTLAYNAVWKFPGGTIPTLSTAASAVDTLFYTVRDSTHIDAVLQKGWA